MSIGNFPEMLSRRILVGIILVGRLGVHTDHWLPGQMCDLQKWRKCRAFAALKCYLTSLSKIAMNIAEFRDVVFEDLVFDNNMFYIIPYLDFT